MIMPIEVPIRIMGIPATAFVKRCEFHKGSHAAIDPDSYYDNYELDYLILDLKGRPAGWLQDKLDKNPDERDSVEKTIIDEYKNYE